MEVHFASSMDETKHLTLTREYWDLSVCACAHMYVCALIKKERNYQRSPLSMVLSLPPGNLHTRSRERESEYSSGLSSSWVQTFGDLNLGMKFHVGCR